MPTVFPDTVTPCDCVTKIFVASVSQVLASLHGDHTLFVTVLPVNPATRAESNLDAVLRGSRRRPDSRNYIFINGNVRPHLVCGDVVFLEMVNRAVVDGHLRHHSAATLHEYARAALAARETCGKKEIPHRHPFHRSGRILESNAVIPAFAPSTTNIWLAAIGWTRRRSGKDTVQMSKNKLRIEHPFQAESRVFVRRSRLPANDTISEHFQTFRGSGQY